jgi:hypothetical protein
LTHILSQGAHQFNHVEDWAEKRLETLRGCTGQAVRVLDLNDDSLRVFCWRWGEFEAALNQHLLRVYDLNPQSLLEEVDPI